jgi:DNA-directed RNA polymerase specialized sigma24 family protein
MMPSELLQTLLDRRARFLSFVQSRVKDRALAEDILQAAYMRALEQTETLREEESAAAWFYSVLRNAVVDHHRRLTSEMAAWKRMAASWRLRRSRRRHLSVAALRRYCQTCGLRMQRCCARLTWKKDRLWRSRRNIS